MEASFTFGHSKLRDINGRKKRPRTRAGSVQLRDQRSEERYILYKAGFDFRYVSHASTSSRHHCKQQLFAWRRGHSTDHIGIVTPRDVCTGFNCVVTPISLVQAFEVVVHIPICKELIYIGIISSLFKSVTKPVTGHSLVKTLKHLAKALRIDATPVIGRNKNMLMAFN